MKPSIHSTWRSSCGRYTVQLTEECVAEMTRLAKEHYPREVGTALVGSYSDDGFCAQVTGLAPLTEDSRGARTRFQRGSRGLREFFDRVFRKSRGLVHYVGEWHSHPDGPAEPSSVDIASVMDIARDPKVQCPECILIVGATDSRAMTLGVVVCSYRIGKVKLRMAISPCD